MSSPWADLSPTSPGGRLLRAAWQPVCRSMDLAPGQVAPITVLGERWTLLRTSAGAPALLGPACPHRGTATHLGFVQGEALTCMHHGWAWEPDGRCVARPDGGACAAVPLRSAPARDHLGLVFAWLGHGPPAALPRWPAFEQPGTLRVLPPEVWPCPWFLRLENTCDLTHLPVTHEGSGLAGLLDPSVPPRVELLPDGLSIEAAAAVPVRVRVLLPDALCFPTPVSEAAGWRDHLVWRVPVDAGSCVSFAVTHVPASVPGHELHALSPRPLTTPSSVAERGQAVLAGQVSLSSLRGADNLTEIEDYVALCGVLRDGSGAPLAGEHLGPADAPILALRRRFVDALEGRARVWTGLPAD